ncbi:MAG: type II toxin-antitoxin system VapC family toxin [Mangrovibacterium sp.]
MKRVLFDTNIILDIALKREPYFELSSSLFKLIDQKKIVAHVTASTITDIYYVAKKEKGGEIAIRFISSLLEITELIGVDKNIIIRAINAKMKDFEDAVQASAAIGHGIKIIITRNKVDFLSSGLEIYTPAEFLESVC